MTTKNQEQALTTSPMVWPGDRAVLFSHYEYRQARKHGRGLENYDMLMRRPDQVDPEQGESPEAERWSMVPASKYLKLRATGWREAESVDELPESWREEAEGRVFFPEQANAEEGSE